MANLDLLCAGYNYMDLNKERNNAYHKYYNALKKAKAMRDPKKRAEAMIEVERLKQIYKSIPINTPTRMGMSKLLKDYVNSL